MTLSAAEIFADLRKHYSGLANYADSGKATSTNGDRVWAVDFKTHFKRGSKFWFEVMTVLPHPQGPFTIFSDGNSHVYTTPEDGMVIGTLDHILSAGDGASIRAISIIMALLLPAQEENNVAWTKIEDWRLLDGDALDGVDCHHLIGSFQTPDDTEIWIEKSSNCVVRIVQIIGKLPPGQEEMDAIEAMMAEQDLSDEQKEEIRKQLQNPNPDGIRNQYDYLKVSVV